MTIANIETERGIRDFAIDAAIDTYTQALRDGLRHGSFDLDEIDSTGRCADLKSFVSEDHEARAHALNAARDAIDELIGDRFALAYRYEDTLQSAARSSTQCVEQIDLLTRDYEARARYALGACDHWRDLDVTSARVKVAVTERLVQSGMSDSAATKAASGDPEYTMRKDQIAVALSQKEHAETERDVAYQRLLSARATLDARLRALHIEEVGKAKAELLANLRDFQAFAQRAATTAMLDDDILDTLSPEQLSDLYSRVRVRMLASEKWVRDEARAASGLPPQFMTDDAAQFVPDGDVADAARDVDVACDNESDRRALDELRT